ncbi:acylneuraminate cytidylyltransferase family protein [Stutzerimonas nitrititolerans]|uniref:acylneuraminate cytidylyltransferase family protein n=1 Tax=Stutzerimonas nitrititolerans TaxID=2482751 RepID=UPI0015E2E47D|nr:acylneuraminate cytidylyltransferase family protein [Stutzerimonas nitrititolerans]MBA1183957.1 acylneuraminate cytidylyltransferase family protein [Stutzerimonas stutzeri]
MSVFAFIFARGGSKGLPGKNIKKLAGIPLLGHAIKIAQSIERVSAIYVSTDCPHIATVAEEFGASVIDRPSELATDTASEWEAWQHAIRYVRKQGLNFEAFLSLPTTSPLRTKADIESCLDALVWDTDIVITVTPSNRNPYFNMVTRSESGASSLILGGNNVKRRQDAPEAFDITTVAYVAKPDFILDNSGLFDGVIKSVIIPKARAIDIDDEIDFRIAEALISK